MKGYNIERKRACLNGTIGFNRSLYERAFWGYFIKDNLDSMLVDSGKNTWYSIRRNQ